MKVIEIQGVDKVVKNLKQALPRKIGRGVEKGFQEAATFIMRESLDIVPVQTGNLKGSAAIKKHGRGLKHVVTMGYFGVSYAPIVHELPGENLQSAVTHGKLFNIKHAAEIEAAKGTWRGTVRGGMFPRKPQEQWKYLEQPIKDNRNKILRIIRDEIKKSIKR